VVSAVAGLVWLDLVLMPLGEPVLMLHQAWLLGEAVAVMAALVPALCLIRWTLRRTRVFARAWAQAVWAGGLMIAVPLLGLASTSPWPPAVTWLGAQLVAVSCLPGLAAMRELARLGRGTPLPYDPPSRLVTSGPYAYVRNPMQTTIVVAYVGLAVTLGAPLLLLGALVAFVYGAGLAEWHEGDQLRRRYGGHWLQYRSSVRPWIPRWRPAPTVPQAVLYVAADCDLCTGVGGWFSAHETTALGLRPAAEHPDVLYRVRYESAGVRADGVAAIARALGHVHLGWALVGWALDLPGMRQFAQLCSDAFGAGPRASRSHPVCAERSIAPVRAGERRRRTAA
jgi:protein-S-isoprenylcysteine O-methyltransferase Ste14